MNYKKELLKILKLIFIFLIILLLVVILFLYRQLSSTQISKNINRYIIKEYKINNVNEIKFDFKNAKVIYTNTNKDNLIIKQTGKTDKYLVHKLLNNKKLEFLEVSNNIFTKVEYNIYIPKNYSNKINIVNGYNNIKIDSFDNDIDIDNNSGNIVIGKCNNLNITNISGNINIKKVYSAKIKSTTGDIFIDSLNNDTNINTITGNIIINKFYIKNTSYLESTSGDIAIIVDKDSLCSLKIDSENNDISKKICKNGSNLLTIKDITGKVTLK